MPNPFSLPAAACLAAAFLLQPAAFADPVGTYSVEGTNPDNGSTYSGTVEVTRTGETYQVVWDIAGQRFVGTGLGALIRDDSFLVGAAESDDTAISVGYKSGDGFGMAMYFEQDDGTWDGIWTYGGSDRVARETWTRR